MQDPAVVFLTSGFPASPGVVEATNPDEYGIFTVARSGPAGGSCIRVTPSYFTRDADLGADLRDGAGAIRKQKLVVRGLTQKMSLNPYILIIDRVL